MVASRELRRIEQRLLGARKQALESRESLATAAHLLEPMADGDLSRFPVHPADQGSDLDALDRQLALARIQDELVSGIDAALRRLYAAPASYGFCESCGVPIAPERLDLLPWTTRCLSCATALEAV